MKQALIAFFLIFGLNMAIAVGADDPGTFEGSPSPACNTLLMDSDMVAAGFKNYYQSFGKRGFLGVQPEVTAASLDAAGKKGIIRWEQRFYIATDIEQAKTHVQAPSSLSDKGLYFILEGEVQEDMFYHLLEQGISVLDEAGNTTVTLSPEDTWKLLDRENLIFHKVDKGLSYYSLEGWVLPKARTIISQKSVDDSEVTFGKIRNKLDGLVRQGHEVYFNSEPEMALELSRKHDSDPVKRSEASVSFGSDMRNFMAMFEQKRAFNAVMFAPSTLDNLDYGLGGMIAGVTGHIQGSLYVIDSIFFPPRDDGERYGEAVFLALIDRLFAAGIQFVDTTKIVSASINKRAAAISLEELVDLIKELPQNPVVDFSTPYQCQSESCD